MLSKPAETKPRPSAVCQLAAGNSSTGISEAAVTSASRKIVPLKVAGISSQSGRRSGAVIRITAQTVRPSTGAWSSSAGNFMFAVTLAARAAIRIAATMPTRTHSICRPFGAFFTIGENFCCWIEAGTANSARAITAAT